MEITKEQVLDLCKQNNWYVNDKLQKWFPRAFKVELEIGKVYWRDKELFKWNDGKNTYGFNSYGYYGNDMSVSTVLNPRLATTEEWQSALIVEAKRRGLYDAVNFKDAYSLLINRGLPCFNKTITDNQIWTKYGCIFCNGIWADIIKTISKEEAEKQLGLKIV
jgi:hypothetical protein